jgi:hypothetical protein
MFDRFIFTSHRENFATFGPAVFESFLADIDWRLAAGTTTRLRYVKLIDRLCRHLVTIDLREANPAFGHGGRDRKQLVARAYHMGCIRTACQRGEDPVADPIPGHVLADFSNAAGNFVTEKVGRDETGCSINLSLPRHAEPVTARCEAS